MLEVTATPNPVAAGENYTLSGSGFEMRPVEVFVDDAFVYAIGVFNGDLDNNHFPAQFGVGDHKVDLYQRREHGPKKDLVATLTLTIT